MALATVEKEILKVMNTSTTGLRNKMASKYIHDITVNAIDMAPVFQNGIQAVMEKAGFQPEIIQQINDRYNKKIKIKLNEYLDSGLIAKTSDIVIVKTNP